MNVVKKHIPKGHANRPGRKLDALRAIVVHYTQNAHPGATAAMNVRYIGRDYLVVNDKKFEADGTTPFRFGSAHIFCDMNMVIEAIPLDEVAWSVGDKSYKGGYQRIAEKMFKRRQNFETISVEICNNDVIKNSDEDWNGAVENAKKWIIKFMNEHNYMLAFTESLYPQTVTEPPTVGRLLLLRHYDVTGKLCPKPFVEDSKAWDKFIIDVANGVDNYGA